MAPYNSFLEKSCLDEHPCYFWELVPTNLGHVNNKEFGLDLNFLLVILMNGLWSSVFGVQDTAWQACLATACCSCMQRCLPGLVILLKHGSFSSVVSGSSSMVIGHWSFY